MGLFPLSGAPIGQKTTFMAVFSSFNIFKIIQLFQNISLFKK
jgi:hypothetical protein